MYMRRTALLASTAAVLATLLSAGSQAWAVGPPPTINSFQANNVTTTSARLSTSITYHEKAGTYWFSYCRVSDCADSTVDTPQQEDNPEDDTQAQLPRTEEWPVDGLRPGTQYRVTVWATNDSNYFKPEQRAFYFTTAAPNVTQVVPASATTDAAADVDATTVTLKGRAVPGTTNGTGIGSAVHFEWGEPNNLNQVTPDQMLPADANPYPIEARLGGLTPNHDYAYRLVVVRNGQRFTGATQTWHSSPAPIVCPTGFVYQTVRFDRIVAAGCFMSENNRWVADGEVRLNGLKLEPVGTAHGTHSLSGVSAALQTALNAGNRFYIDKPGHAFGSTGQWKISAPLHKVGGVPQYETLYKTTLDFSGLTWGGTDPLLSLGGAAGPTANDVDLLDLPLAGSLTYTPVADGSSKLGVSVTVPVPHVSHLTGDAAIKINPNGDLALDRLIVEVGQIPVRGFELGDLKLAYDGGEDRWEGAASVTLPTASRVKLAAAVTITHGHFSAFEGSVDNLNQHLDYGVFLQKVGVRVGYEESDLHLGGTIGLSAGPKVEGIGIFGLEGGFDLHTSGGDGWYRPPGDRYPFRVAYPGSISVTGTGSVFSLPIASLSATWYFSQTPWIEAHAQWGVNLQALGITVLQGTITADANVYGSTFEAGGEITGVVAGYPVAGVSAIANTTGIGACAHVLGVADVGGWYRWGHGSHTRVDPFVEWCNMGNLRDAIASASAAAAGGSRPLALPAGDSALVRFYGRGGAPQGVLHGPGGRTVASPAAGQTNGGEKNSFLSIRHERERYTDVVIAKPSAGWRYQAAAGSVPVTDVQTAAELPKLKVSAHVRRHGRQAKLSWKLGHLAGRRVTFMESGPGAPARVLKRTTASHGSVRFTPYQTRQRTRVIVALVEKDGMPVARTVVARYTAPAAPRVTAVHRLRAVRHRSTLKVSWRKQAGADRYRVFVAEKAGRRTLRTVHQHRLTIRGAHARAVKSVAVQAVGFDGRIGRKVTAKVK
jgi:hypothetical protein